MSCPRCQTKASGREACYKCCKNKLKCPLLTGRSKKRCKADCDATNSRYAPEPSNQYELDSFEIGTESAICEDCGEIHGLDEYEEMGCSDEIDGFTHGINLPKNPKKATWKAWRAYVIGELKKIGLPQKLRGEEYLGLWNAFENAKSYDSMARAGSRLSNSPAIKGPIKIIMRCGQTGPGKNVKKFRKYTSEPIPDYIMRALQPKKSVHSEYGKLRY